VADAHMRRGPFRRAVAPLQFYIAPSARTPAETCLRGAVAERGASVRPGNRALAYLLIRAGFHATVSMRHNSAAPWPPLGRHTVESSFEV
jgi:hypothetical protein